MKTLWVRRLPKERGYAWGDKIALLGKDPADWISAYISRDGFSVYISGINGGWDINLFETSEQDPNKTTLEELL